MRSLTTQIINTTMTIALGIFATSCSGAPPPPPTNIPEATSESEVVQDISEIEINLISIRLDTIRLTDRVTVEAIPLDSVWMIPIGMDREIDGRWEYLEAGNDVVITRSDPYEPSSPWFISVEREELNGENFGIWFMATHFGDNSVVTRELFDQIVIDASAVIIAGGASFWLTTTPIPDEAVTAAVAVRRGRSLMSSAAALGGAFIATRGDNMIEEFTSRQVDNAYWVAEEMDKVSYFAEVYVIIPAAENYLLDNQISAVTADGSLEFVFSVIQTSTNGNEVENFVADETLEDVFPAENCNPDFESNLISGMQARVTRPLNVLNRVIDQDPSFRLRQGDIVETVIPFCDFTEQTQWWRVRYMNENNELQTGWVTEIRNQRGFFLEPVNHD
jgi:hypothetical protein